jgi:MarR family transcriptional regulator, 2-MHQ and catechol-resistance regulon repressor
MPREPFLVTLRELVRCYQAFESHSAEHIRRVGLTPPQFDIVATLGNTAGMSFKELGERTLITKGTLTGVVDRLESRGVVRRVAAPNDRRSQIVQLTDEGQALFEQVFPEHMDHLRRAFEQLGPAELHSMEDALRRLRLAFTGVRGRTPALHRAEPTEAEA